MSLLSGILQGGHGALKVKSIVHSHFALLPPSCTWRAQRKGSVVCLNPTLVLLYPTPTGTDRSLYCFPGHRNLGQSKYNDSQWPVTHLHLATVQGKETMTLMEVPASSRSRSLSWRSVSSFKTKLSVFGIRAV